MVHIYRPSIVLRRKTPIDLACQSRSVCLPKLPNRPMPFRRKRTVVMVFFDTNSNPGIYLNSQTLSIIHTNEDMMGLCISTRRISTAVWKLPSIHNTKFVFYFHLCSFSWNIRKLQRGETQFKLPIRAGLSFLVLMLRIQIALLLEFLFRIYTDFRNIKYHKTSRAIWNRWTSWNRSFRSLCVVRSRFKLSKEVKNSKSHVFL